MLVQRLLVLPDINEQDSFGVVHWEEIGVAFVSGFTANQGGCPAVLHFLGKFAGVAARSGIVQIYDDAHNIPSFWFCIYLLLGNGRYRRLRRLVRRFFQR